VRKILSIVITLGLVLGLSLIAMPTAAWDCDPEEAVAEVVVYPDCACEEAVYNITFNTSASLTEGTHSVCIEFPAGTTIPASFLDGDILISRNGGTQYAVFGSEVTITGTTVCFLTPVDFDAGEITVEFSDGLENPCDPGDYSLWVWTSRAPDSVPIEGEYEIVPAFSSYGFLFDFNPTYPGVAVGFVPPFKACGQNDTTDEAIEAGFDTTYVTEFGGFVTNFTLYFMDFVEGCFAPCAAADFWLEIHSIPEGEEMHLVLNGTQYIFDVCNITKTVADYDATTDILLLDDEPMAASMTIFWPGALHFSSPGTYTIGLYVECPKTTCFPGGIIAEKVQSFVAHQDKDAAKIVIEEKWNLISLPLHPYDTSLTSLMAAWDLDDIAPFGVSELVSIHHFDQCADAWTVYGGGQTSLSTMEAGKSYWVRMVYPAGQYTLWVWGTAKPMPPEAPAVYTMCDGWNMFGFTSLLDSTSDVYLWNFGGAGEPPFPLIYKWNNTGTWTTSGWVRVDSGDAMAVGEGFWGYFALGGSIVPP
jgi:hypothetical protein